jgi:peptide deformylase
MWPLSRKKQDPEKELEVLTLSVSDGIKTAEAPPGTPTPTAKELEEKLPPEEVEKRRRVMLEYTRLCGRYCPPHNKKSRWVTKKDLQEVVADGKDLVAMCRIPRGKYSGISALAHPQIDDKDPLRFFVLPNGMVIINPVITGHTKVPVSKDEGCMSFPDRDIKTGIPRYNKVDVTYQTLTRKDEKSDPGLSLPITEKLSGGISHIFQHECGHLNGCNIYDSDYDSDKSLWLGDGKPVSPDIWEKNN